MSEHRAGLLALGPVRAFLPNSTLLGVGLHEKVGSLSERNGRQSGARGVAGRGEIDTFDAVEGQIHPEAVTFGIDVPGQDLTSLGGVRNQVVRASPSCNAMPGANRKVRALDDRNCCERRQNISVLIAAITKAGHGPENSHLRSPAWIIASKSASDAIPSSGGERGDPMDPALAPPLCLRASIIFAFARLFGEESTKERIKGLEVSTAQLRTIGE